MQIQVAMHDAYLVLLLARARQFRTCRASRLGHDCMQTGYRVDARAAMSLHGKALDKLCAA